MIIYLIINIHPYSPLLTLPYSPLLFSTTTKPKTKMFVTSIFITEGKYDDKVNLNIKDLYNLDKLVIQWEGQAKTRKYDSEEYGVGSYIFYRPKSIKEKYFIYLGKVSKSTIIRDRVKGIKETEENEEVKEIPIKKEFEILIDNIIFCKFTDKDEEQDNLHNYPKPGKYYRAAMRRLNLHIKNGNQREGAYKHSLEPFDLLNF